MRREVLVDLATLKEQVPDVQLRGEVQNVSLEIRKLYCADFPWPGAIAKPASYLVFLSILDFLYHSKSYLTISILVPSKTNQTILNPFRPSCTKTP